MTVVVDYGCGNLFSLRKSLEALGCGAVVSGEPDVVQSADSVILPGVGAFGDAADALERTGLASAVITAARRGTPVLGICLGMQLLFEKSFEFGEHKGLCLIPGVVRSLRDVLPAGYKTPHIGWNALDVARDDPFFRYFPSGAHVYYVHSFYATDCEDYTLATSEYAVRVPGVVRAGNVIGCQFHPEKSGAAGLSLLRAFVEGV